MIKRKSKILFFLLTMLSCTSIQKFTYDKNDIPRLIKQINSNFDKLVNFSANSHITLNSTRDDKIVSDDIRSESYIINRDTFILKFIYSIFNANVASFYIDPDYYVFTMKNPKESDNFIRGLSSDRYLNQLFQIDIPLKEWDDILFLGNNKLDSVYESFKINEIGEVAIFYVNKIVTIHKDFPFPIKITWLRNKNVIAEITYDNLTVQENFILPRDINYYNKRLKSEMIIQNSSFEINKTIDKEKLRLSVHTKMEQILYD